MKTGKLQKRQIVMLAAGLLALIIGLSVLSFIIIRRIYRDVQREKLMRGNVVIEIPELHINTI